MRHQDLDFSHTGNAPHCRQREPRYKGPWCKASRQSRSNHLSHEGRLWLKQIFTFWEFKVGITVQVAHNS